ncbi:contact-dependent growth inhibition system immunity protein [Streptomyces sp. NPDC004542]|uniref:contact-dependent growth inhibition system immunity protein n=1 Tax=Streptomyces sp. NPDC004542 TaxID=3154281 RepID=UPI0033A4536C
MSEPLDLSKSLEQLEGRRWPEPPEGATSLIKAIHALRRRPVGALESHELARLIAQKEGVPLLLPLAVKILRESAQTQAESGYFLDDELLYATVIVSPDVWAKLPELARELGKTVSMMTDLSSYVKPDVEAFLASLPKDGPAS